MATGRSINNILGKGYLCSETQTIPQKELGVLSAGTFITKTLKEELGPRLGRTIVAADSLVAIYWALLATKETVNVYTWNRVENIRSNILIATELFHVAVAGKHIPADQGTRWRSMNTEMTTNNNKLLTCNMVAP